jgi:heat shock protein HslJ
MPQEPTQWTLQSFVEDGKVIAVLPDTTITLHFDEDTLRETGAVFGSAGCNTYHATYTYGEMLAFSPIVTTRMACPPPIMEQEARFLRLLQQVTTYQLDNELRLKAAEGRDLLLVFTAQP